MAHQGVPCLVPPPERLVHHGLHLDFLFALDVFVLADVVVVQEGGLQLLVQLVARLVVLCDHLRVCVDLVPSLACRHQLLAVRLEPSVAEDRLASHSEFALGHRQVRSVVSTATVLPRPKGRTEGGW